jgi:hypothetical protein
MWLIRIHRNHFQPNDFLGLWKKQGRVEILSGDLSFPRVWAWQFPSFQNSYLCFWKKFVFLKVVVFEKNKKHKTQCFSHSTLHNSRWHCPAFCEPHQSPLLAIAEHQEPWVSNSIPIKYHVSHFDRDEPQIILTIWLTIDNDEHFLIIPIYYPSLFTNFFFYPLRFPT